MSVAMHGEEIFVRPHDDDDDDDDDVSEGREAIGGLCAAEAG